ncbi:MAG TPA: VOC family protein [Vicinamibacterales bacterium]|nr:VOC family protein [Vicinamibacterales bacterium]
MRSGTIAAVFVAGFISGHMVQARQETPRLPAERVTGIGGIFIKARDPKTLAAWYTDNLGVPRPNGPIPPLFRWRDHDNPNSVGTTVWAMFNANTKYFAPSTAPFMINYRVNNLDGLLARLRAAGVTIEGKAVEDFNGKFGWVMDPEGHKIELWEPKPGF